MRGCQFHCSRFVCAYPAKYVGEKAAVVTNKDGKFIATDGQQRRAL